MSDMVYRKDSVAGQWIIEYDSMAILGCNWTASFHWDDPELGTQGLGFHSPDQEDIVAWLTKQGFVYGDDADHSGFEFQVFFSYPEDVSQLVIAQFAENFEGFHVAVGTGFWQGVAEVAVTFTLMSEEDIEGKVRRVAQEIADKWEQEAVLVTKKASDIFWQVGRRF